jgi:hypothetical protein
MKKVNGSDSLGDLEVGVMLSLRRIIRKNFVSPFKAHDVIAMLFVNEPRPLTSSCTNVNTYM